MHTEVIKTKTEGVEPVAIEYDFPDSLDEATDLYGEDVVFAKFVAQLRIDLQSFVREQLKPKEGQPPKTEKEIRSSAKDWKPGVKQRGKTKVEKGIALFEEMSPEQRKDLLKQMKAAGVAA